MSLVSFESFAEKLSVQLHQPLPGETAQMKMRPANRLTLQQYHEQSKINPRKSAVLICFYPHHGSVYTVLMLRPSKQGVHSDQISFPGGRFEETDFDLQTTALREAEEEVGIAKNEVKILGALTPLYIPVSNSLVHPFVGFTSSRPSFKKNDAEVEQIIETDAMIFLNDEIKGNGIFLSKKENEIEAPFYLIQNYKIWGATAMMLSEMEAIMKNIF